MQDFAIAFYKSQAWRDCRDAYSRSKGGLCERCLERGIYRPGVIVHHKIHLTPDNIGDASVSLNFANLELLCREHHGEEHKRNIKRYSIDKNGRVVANMDRI